MIRKIKELTKIFIKDYYQNLNIIKNKKINSKNRYVWLLIILIITLSYLSLNIVNFFSNTQQPELFLKIYLPIIALMLLFQLISLTCNIFYYSKDIEHVLPLPLKPIEILMAKFNTIISIMYLMEGLFLLIPLIIYGLLIQRTIIYFALMILVVILFPILFTTTISIIMLLVMKLSKIIKNKDIFQLIVTFTLTMILFSTLSSNIQNLIPNNIDTNTALVVNEKISEINNIFLIINPIIKILTSRQFGEILLNLLVLVSINLLSIIVFCYIGSKLYLKNVLRNIENINTHKNVKHNYKYKRQNKVKTYLKNDIKNIIKNPIFLIQNVFQYLLIALVVIFLLNTFLPIYIEQIISENTIQEMGIDEFSLQSILIFVGMIQIIFTFSNLAITAISREGKNAVFMKYIPVSLFTQLKIKILPSVIINTIIIIGGIVAIFLNIPTIPIIYYIVTFIICMLINLINSYLMILIDLKNPNLNWTNKDSVTKDNKNKLYQYINTIFIILLLSYLAKIFDKMKFCYSILIVNVILGIIYFVLRLFIKKNVNRLFEKIY